MCQLVVIVILLTGIPLAWSCGSLAWPWAWKSDQLWSGGGGGEGGGVRPFFRGMHKVRGTILGRFSIIYFRGLGLRIRVRVGVRVCVVL